MSRSPDTARVKMLLVALAAGLLVAVPASALTPGPLIAFNAGLDGGHPDVVTVTPDGATLRNLTPGEQTFYTSDIDPSWSSDGRFIAFESHRDSNVSTEIYVMNADGSEPRRLTTDSGQNQIFNLRPAWSPSGDLIAFEKSRNGQNYDLWVMRPDGSGQRALTSDGSQKSVAAWSPDGKLLLYTRQESPGSRIYTVGLDGSPPVPLSPAGAYEYYPAWSPDGTKIAFSAPALTVMNADGSGRHPLTDIGTAAPSWSPDGAWIAFGGYRSFPQYGSRFGIPSREDVFVVHPDGSGLRRLTGPFDDGLYGAAGGEVPTWWPDGSRLFFVSQRYPGPLTTFQMNADGTCEGRFDPGGPQLQRPVWRPSGLPLQRQATCAELRVSGFVERSPLALKEVVRAHLRIDNDGNEAATQVRVRISANSGSSAVPDSSGCTQGTCTIGRIEAQGSAELLLDVSRRTAGRLHLTVDVSAAEPDTDQSDNAVELWADVLPCTIVGTYDNDYLYGTPRADRICGLPGADHVFGRTGNDFIDAGNGDDRIYPGPGNDTVIAKGGDDIVYARDGQRDWIDCGAQKDIAIVDRQDVVTRCEYVLRPKR